MTLTKDAKEQTYVHPLSINAKENKMRLINCRLQNTDCMLACSQTDPSKRSQHLRPDEIKYIGKRKRKIEKKKCARYNASNVC